MTNDLFSKFASRSIGFQDIFNEFDEAKWAGARSNLPYNIIEISKTEYRIELALAGFSMTEVKVTVDNDTLIVESAPIAKGSERLPMGKYLHKGISSRAFQQTFVLAENVQVKSATMANGILTIDMERVIPESEKPIRIDITKG